MDARTAGFRRRGDAVQPVGAGAAAVQAHERVAPVDRNRRAVEELLHRQPLGRHPRRLPALQRALGGGPLVGAGADQLEQPRRRLDPELTFEGRLDRGRHVFQPLQGSAERAGELRQPHQRAEVARGERRAALRLDRLDVDPRRAAPPDDDDRRTALPAQLLEHLAREPLRVAVAQNQDGVVVLERQAVERGVHRLHRGRPHAGLAQQPDRVVRGMPARARADRDDAPAGEPLGLRGHGARIGEQHAQVGRLPPHRGRA